MRWPWSKPEPQPIYDAEYWEKRARLAEARAESVESYVKRAKDAEARSASYLRAMDEMQRGRTVAHLERLLHKRNRKIATLRDELRRARRLMDARLCPSCYAPGEAPSSPTEVNDG